MRTCFIKRLAAVSAAFVLAVCLFCQPVFATTANPTKKATSSKMSIQKIEDNVVLRNQNGRKLVARVKRKLYKGYTLTTDKDGTAFINLDDNKVIKLGEASSVQIKKSGKKLDILLKSGSMFFDFGKLAADETLNIRTSTTITGIRGTCGIVRILRDDELVAGGSSVLPQLTEPGIVNTENVLFQLYHGEIGVAMKDNPSAGVQYITAGQELRISEQANAAPSFVISDITPNTADVLACIELSQPLYTGGFSLDDAKTAFAALFNGESGISDFVKEKIDAHKALISIITNLINNAAAQLVGETELNENAISPLFDKQTQPESSSASSIASTPAESSGFASSTPSSSTPASSTSASSAPVSSTPTSSIVSSAISSIPVSSASSSESIGSELDTKASTVNVAAINRVFSEYNVVTISGTGNAVIDSDLTLTSNQRIRVSPGATLTISSGKTLACGGEIINAGTINNRGTLTIDGTVTNDGTMNNTGTITNNSFNSFYQNGNLTSSGSINNNGFMQIDNGLTYTGSGTAITNSAGAILTLRSGTVTAKSGIGISNSGTLNIDEGKITALASDKLVTGSGTINRVSGIYTTAIINPVFTGSYAADGSYVMSNTFDGFIAAIGGVGTNQSVALISDQTLNSSVTVSASGVTLLLGTHTLSTGGNTVTVSGADFTLTGGRISASPNATAFSVSSGGEMTVSDTSFAYASASNTCLPFIVTSGSLTLKTGTLTGNQNREIVTVQRGGNFEMQNGSILGGSVVNNGTFNMTGGSMAALTLLDGDSRSYNVTNAGTFNHSGGTINGDTSVLNNGTYTVSDGASIIGAATAISNSSTLNINGGTVRAVTIGIENNAGVLTMTGGTVNITSTSGNPLVNDATANITGGSLTAAASTDSLIQNGGLLTLGTDLNYVGSGSAITNSTGATLTLNSGTVTAKSSNGISNAGTLNFAGGRINAQTHEKLVIGSGTVNNMSGATATPLTDLVFTGSYTADGSYVMSGSFNGISAALSGAAANQNIVLATNQTLTSPATVASANVRLILNSKTLTTGAYTVNVTGAGFSVDGGTIITDYSTPAFTVATGGSMSMSATDISYATNVIDCSPHVSISGRFSLVSGTLNGYQNYDVVTVNTGGEFNFENGTVAGGSIKNNGTMTMTGGSVTEFAGLGGALGGDVVNTGTFTHSGGTISSLICVRNTGTYTISGNAVLNASTCGLSNNGIANINGGTINATTYGVSNHVTVNMTAGLITASGSESTGIQNYGDAILSGGSITTLRSAAFEHNGGTAMLSGTSLISGVALPNNPALPSGSYAIYIAATGVTFNGSHIKTTSARYSPIGVAVGFSPTTLYNLISGRFTSGAVLSIDGASGINTDINNGDGTYSHIVG